MVSGGANVGTVPHVQYPLVSVVQRGSHPVWWKLNTGAVHCTSAYTGILGHPVPLPPSQRPSVPRSAVS